MLFFQSEFKGRKRLMSQLKDSQRERERQRQRKRERERILTKAFSLFRLLMDRMRPINIGEGNLYSLY